MTSSLKLKFDKAPRRALFLSADKLTIYHWDRGKLGSSYIFDSSIDGQEYFDRYLRETPNTPVYILVDVLEEEYKQDTIPHVYGADRKTLIDRKKSRLFRETPYFHADIQGRQEEGRRDDQVLFMGLTKPEILKPWLALLEKHKTPLAGIYSFPYVTTSILEFFPETSKHMLVVSLQSISGLRQSFFRDNKLKISRLVKMPRYGTAPYSIEIRDEVEKVQRYLSGMHLIPEEDPLDVYILANNELNKEIESLGVNAALIKYHFIDIGSLSNKIRLDMDVTTPFCDRLIAHHLLQNKPPNLYGLSTETRYYQMRKMRQAMQAASMVMLFGGIIWGGLNLMGGLSYKQQAMAADNKTNFYNARYQLAREKLPQTPVPPTDLELLVNAAETLNNYKTSPLSMFSLISQGLENFPMIVLDEIEWVSSVNPNVLQDKTQEQTPADQAVLGVGEIVTESRYKYYQVAAVKGHLKDFNGNYRMALNTIDEFSHAIKKMQSVHNVSVTSLPLDIGSNTNLQGGTNTEISDAKFSVRIVLGMN